MLIDVIDSLARVRTASGKETNVPAYFLEQSQVQGETFAEQIL